jgi:hypothetical protein
VKDKGRVYPRAMNVLCMDEILKYTVKKMGNSEGVGRKVIYD